MAQWVATRRGARLAPTKDDMLRLFGRIGCHLAREPGAPKKLVALEHLALEEHLEHSKGLMKTFSRTSSLA